MLKIMANETEIFRKWLHRVIRDKKLTVDGEPAKAKDLAKALKINAATLTGYHLGRSLPGGERHFPDIPHDIQVEILEKTRTPREEMLRIGRIENAPKDPDIYERVEALEKQKSQTNYTNDNSVLSIHHQIIEQFQQKELALEINHAMLELERMNPDELKEIAKYVHFRKSEAKKIQPPAPQKKRG
jgi:hypothetical protein